ncbi:MAG: GNAT family protein [Planctomycetota bacterium]
MSRADRVRQDAAEAPPPVAIQVDDRITLRLAGVDEAPAIFELVERNRQHISPWMSWFAQTQSVEDVAEFRRKSIQSYQDRSALTLQIYEEDRVIGGIGFYGLDDPHGSAELGYWLDASTQGRGVMTRCAQALLDHAFAEYGLHRVYLTADAANRRSIAVAERLGMRREGEMKQDVHMPGIGYRDSVLYAILAEEWKAARP